MDKENLETPIHAALSRPVLVLGGERNLVLLLAMVAGVFILSIATIWSIVLGLTLWVLGQWALARAAEFDPQLSQVGIRHLRFKRFYPAQSTPFARPREYER